MLLAIFAGVAYGAVRFYRFMHYPEWHAQVAIGDTEIDVRKEMGAPDRIATAPEPLSCDGNGTVRELIYGQSIPPEWWVMGLDRLREVGEDPQVILENFIAKRHANDG